MATIQGTEGKDTLQGTIGEDRILALGGNDRIIGTLGNDLIDGGAGNDTIDFSNIDETLLLANTGEYLSVPYNNPIATARLSNIETIIANPNRFNGIVSVPNFPSSSTNRIDVDLSKNRLTVYTDADSSSKTFTIKNFNYITILGNNGNNRLAGDDRDNNIFGGAPSDVVIGSKGNDAVNGFGTLDYSNLGRAVKLSPLIGLNQTIEGNIDKGNFGTDKFSIFRRIIGTTNKVNEIDASSNADGYSLDLNLANNSLKLNNPNASPQQIEVTNFVNVIGTKSNDTIIGANKNSKLTGGGGNDTITGGTKNDRLTGTDPTARGVGEVDTLTGSGGKDKFVLGDKNGAYYVGKGSNDYALINNFNIFNDSLDLGKFKDYSFGLEGNNTINLFSGKDANTRDLIAKIKIEDAGNLISKGSSLSSKSSSILGESNLNIDAIVAKLDILSGSNSTDFS